jgi:hypothetical protein
MNLVPQVGSVITNPCQLPMSACEPDLFRLESLYCRTMTAFIWRRATFQVLSAYSDSDSRSHPSAFSVGM